MRAVVVLSLALTAASGCHSAAAFTWSPPSEPEVSPTLNARVDMTAPMRGDFVMMTGAPAVGVDAGMVASDAGEEVSDAGPPEADAGVEHDAGIDRDPIGPPGCGNGRIDADETCDFGPDADDACSAGVVSCMLCKGCELVLVVAPPCGNGVLDVDEDCDDANHDDGDGCSALCTVE